MKNSEKFLNSFAALEKHLRAISGATKATSFYQLLEMARAKNALISRYQNDLKEYADLRNAIVHERSDGHVIAEPNDRATADLEQIFTAFANPPRVVPAFQKKVFVCDKNSPLSEAVVMMLNKSFSQVPITEGVRVLGVLTANTIARWLGHESKKEIVSVTDITVDEVLKYTEDRENHCFLARTATLFQALNCFEKFDGKGKDLDAVLITETGHSNQKVIGILTLYDLPKLLTLLHLQAVRIV